MISTALKFSRDVLNQFIKNRLGVDEDKALLNNIIESNGEIPKSNANKIVISLINIEKETAKPFNIRNVQFKNGSYSDVNPAERYNLDILVSANFDDYTETLKFLDTVLVFFQANPCLDSKNYSNIPKGLTKLEFEAEKITYNQMHSLWTAMGAKYQPSVLYKIRLITIQATQTAAIVTAVANTDNTVINDN